MQCVTWPGSPSGASKVAALLPGAGYTVQAPLLYWCAELLIEHGWRVQAIEWTITEDDRSHGRRLAEEAAELAFSSVPAATDRLVVAKSFGTYALPWAVEADVAGAWLTPVLVDDDVRDALRRAPSSHLAIGGDRDALWGPAASLTTAATLVTVPGAEHSLQVPGDWRQSLELQRGILARVADWVSSASSVDRTG